MDSKAFFSYGYVRFLLTLILVAVLVALGAYASYTLKQAKYYYSGPTVVSVTGVGEVFAKPDIGQFSFSVYAEAEDATTAQSESAAAINAIKGYLESEGIEEKDIKTSYYNLNPKYRYEDRVCTFGSYCPPGEPIMDGFEVNQTIEVKVRDLEKAGNLISGVGERGATNISGLSFTIDDTEILKAQARQKAIENAQEKVTELANSLGVHVVRMNGYWEEENQPYYGVGYGGAEMALDSRATVAPEIPTGENSITSRVNISYEVQ